MSIADWLQKRSNAKSTSNIVDGLRQLVIAVRADVQEGELSQAQATAQPPAFERRRERKAAVFSAQQKLYDDLTRWSTLAPKRVLNEIVLPTLLAGNLVARSDPSFGSVVAAAYRVCEAAAKHKGLNLESHTPPEILQLVRDTNDIYK